MSACIFCAIDRHEVYDIPVFSESAFVSDRIIGSMVSTVVLVCDMTLLLRVQIVLRVFFEWCKLG